MHNCAFSLSEPLTIILNRSIQNVECLDARNRSFLFLFLNVFVAIFVLHFRVSSKFLFFLRAIFLFGNPNFRTVRMCISTSKSLILIHNFLKKVSRVLIVLRHLRKAFDLDVFYPYSCFDLVNTDRLLF